MKNWVNKSGIVLATCLVELAAVRYGDFAFIGIFVIFALISGMMILMGHKDLGWGLLIGTLLFLVALLLFGWVFMPGWPGPQEFLNGKRFQKQ